MIGESSLSNKDVGVGIYIDSKSMCWPSLVVSYVANLHTSLRKFKEIVKDREAWHAKVHGITNSRT